MIDPAGVAGMPVIGLGCPLIALEQNLFRIDDDHVITAIHMRGVTGLCAHGAGWR